MKLAKLFDTEVVSADSRQIYKELSIGTAKPTLEEMQGVVHHFVDAHSIEMDYSIGKFESEGLQVLEGIYKNKNIAILSGGSGLYVKVLCEGMDEVPDADHLIREELNARYKAEGLDPLLMELKEADPVYYGQVDASNPQRVIRGLEVYRATGTPFSEFRTGVKKNRPFQIVKVGLLWDRKELYKRIDWRMDQMIANGLFEEAASLLRFKDKNALQTVGYKEIFDFLEGKYDQPEAIRLLKRNSRRYAKRQMTWFNKDQQINWFEAGNDAAIIDFVKNKIETW